MLFHPTSEVGNVMHNYSSFRIPLKVVLTQTYLSHPSKASFICNVLWILTDCLGKSSFSFQVTLFKWLVYPWDYHQEPWSFSISFPNYFSGDSPASLNMSPVTDRILDCWMRIRIKLSELWQVRCNWKNRINRQLSRSWRRENWRHRYISTGWLRGISKDSGGTLQPEHGTLFGIEEYHLQKDFGNKIQFRHDGSAHLELQNATNQILCGIRCWSWKRAICSAHLSTQYIFSQTQFTRPLYLLCRVVSASKRILSINQIMMWRIRVWSDLIPGTKSSRED